MEKPPRKINTLANKITILRIITIPGIVISLLENKINLTVGLLAFCFVTDLLDGFVARRTGQQSPLGSFLDPMADKLLLTSVFMTLSYLDLVDMWVFVVVFSRDLVIVLGWLVIFILTGSSKIQPRILGKLATGAQMITALAVIWHIPFDWQKILVWGTVGITITSGVEYILVGEKRLGEWN